MARQIQPPNEALEAAYAQVRAQVQEQRSLDGKIQVEVSLPVTQKRVRVQISTVAYEKMRKLIQGFSTEVGWYGVTEKVDDALFRVSDILVYPQIVTGGTVDTDAEHRTWKTSLGRDTFLSLRSDGHSHVNMPAFPSSRDLNDQRVTFSQMGRGCKFYIFMIWNKRMERHIRVFDLETNLLYENEDVDVSIGEGGVDLDGFLAEAKKLVKTPAKAVPAKPQGYSPYEYGPPDDYPPDDEDPRFHGGGFRVKPARGGQRKHG